MRGEQERKAKVMQPLFFQAKPSLVQIRSLQKRGYLLRFSRARFAVHTGTYLSYIVTYFKVLYCSIVL